MESPSASPHTEHRHMSTGSSFLTSRPRCTQCNARPVENGRNLVVCIDGTSNQLGQNNTNVVKLFTKIDRESTHPKQYAYYSSGVGTRPGWLHIFDRMERAVADKFDMAVAWNAERTIKDAYGWLARMYQEGDQIYLFGFSRGAYQVRVLAGMIYEAGLIMTPSTEQIGVAYNHYKANRTGNLKTRRKAKEFKDAFSWKGLRVHFIGVWDTVSSVGLIRRDDVLSLSFSAEHACHFRHALALDELRVKFMPEYFFEANSLAEGEYIVTSSNGEFAISQWLMSILGEGVFEGKGKKLADIKEVWFAGSHSDIGGTNRPGKSYHAGNVSLVWMRREATASGLLLEPSDIVWIPEDLDFGISDSMNYIWRVIEYMPIRHQVSFCGTGENARRMHRLQPRCFVPGQTLHVSLLYANAYEPKATLGEGLDTPVIRSELEDMELDGETWEAGLFDDTAAQVLLTRLGHVPIYLDRLLFMLQFEEGKQCVRNVPNWEAKLKKVIKGSDAPLVRVTAVIAYYEASRDSDDPLSNELLKSIPDADKCLSGILADHDHQDGHTVLALLRPLTKHPILRKHILTQGVLDAFVKLLDATVERPKGYFAQTMDGLSYLLQCKDTQKALVENLGANPTDSAVSRLDRILGVEDLHYLTAALRMMLTLARIPEARAMCSALKPRIRKLAVSDHQLIGLLAIEILLALYDPGDHLDFSNTHVRANLTNALVHLNPNKRDPKIVEGPGQLTLRYLFGLDVTELNKQQKMHIGTLKTDVQWGNVRSRTTATMTLLKLCHIVVIRAYLQEIKLLDVFVDQLRHEDSALLAAYALLQCLQYSDLKNAIKDNEDLPKHIVGMLILDYFDDVVFPYEGFQILKELMQHVDLREKLMDYDITEVLDRKLKTGKLKKIRTGLLCLGIFHSFNPHGPWTHELVAKSLEYLRNPAWKVQKAGVTILSALVQTECGVAAIAPRIHKIIEMLLPQVNPRRSVGQARPVAATTESTDVQSSAVRDAPPMPVSWMMGPACALRILAQNETLRFRASRTAQYGRLKDLHVSRMLVVGRDTLPWHVNTPSRNSVNDMLDDMIEAFDGELSGKGYAFIGDVEVPHIQHWNRLVILVQGPVVAAVTVCIAVLAISTLAILAAILFTPIYLSFRAYDVFKQRHARSHDGRIFDDLRPTRRAARGQSELGKEGGEDISFSAQFI